MKQAFVIMQIGNKQLDSVYNNAIVPAIKACGFKPKRVDKHNEGGLLKSEIVNFIETSDIIVADLTNERPNCYLEVGYAMGLDKFRNLIMTSREDHNQDSSNYKKGGLKIHFDLQGYDILFWEEDNLDKFKEELEKRIKRRLATLITLSSKTEIPWDNEWINKQQTIALSSLKQNGRNAFMEIRMILPESDLNISQGELLKNAEKATINTFGWPIGVVLNRRDEYRPRPKTNRIVANIDTGDHYDYWTIRKDGAFYLLKSLFEDVKNSDAIFFDIRIIRITETLLYAVRLYSGFGIPPNSRIIIGIKHSGLKDRVLISANPARDIREGRESSEDEVYTEIDTTIEGIESNLVEFVGRFIEELFIIFDYFELNKSVLEEIVNNFVEGKST